MQRQTHLAGVLERVLAQIASKGVRRVHLICTRSAEPLLLESDRLQAVGKTGLTRGWISQWIPNLSWTLANSCGGECGLRRKIHSPNSTLLHEYWEACMEACIPESCSCGNYATKIKKRSNNYLVLCSFERSDDVGVLNRYIGQDIIFHSLFIRLIVGSTGKGSVLIRIVENHTNWVRVRRNRFMIQVLVRNNRNSQTGDQKDR